MDDFVRTNLFHIILLFIIFLILLFNSIFINYHFSNIICFLFLSHYLSHTIFIRLIFRSNLIIYYLYHIFLTLIIFIIFFPYLLYIIKPLIIFCAHFDHTISFVYIFTHILMTWTFVWRRRHDTYGIGLLGSAARDTCDICGAAVVLCGRRSTCFT